MSSSRKAHGKTVTVGLLGLSLLSVLRKMGEPTSGGDIWDALEEQSGKRVHSGTIYTTLKRMREKGLVIESVTQQGRPARTYRLTELGSEVLSDYRRVFSDDSVAGGATTQ